MAEVPATFVSTTTVFLALIATIFAAARTWSALKPIIEERKRRRILNRTLAYGPFDKSTIKKHTRHYIRPHFTNLDPATEEESRRHLVSARAPLFPEFERWLRDPSDKKYLLLLAGSGLGKTSFLLNYFAYNTTLPSRRRKKISLVALGRPDADAQLARIDNKAERVVFLDAFDEDVQAQYNHRDRIFSLMKKCSDFRAVVVTCRTQFFLRDEEIPKNVGVVQVHPRPAGRPATYEFRKLYLAPFDDQDIESFIRRLYPIWAWRQRTRARKLVDLSPNLCMRPMLLASLPEIMELDSSPRTSWQMYEVMVDAWLRRESPWIDKAVLLSFSKHVAVDLYAKRELREMEAMPAKELGKKAVEIGLPQLQEWQLTSRSLLNRDAEGNFKFSHRSIMEFLFLQAWADDPTTIPRDFPLTEQMKSFIEDRASDGWILDGANSLWRTPREFGDRTNVEVVEGRIRLTPVTSLPLGLSARQISRLKTLGTAHIMNSEIPRYEAIEQEEVEVFVHYITDQIFSDSDEDLITRVYPMTRVERFMMIELVCSIEYFDTYIFAKYDPSALRRLN